MDLFLYRFLVARARELVSDRFHEMSMKFENPHGRFNILEVNPTQLLCFLDGLGYCLQDILLPNHSYGSMSVPVGETGRYFVVLLAPSQGKFQCGDS